MRNEYDFSNAEKNPYSEDLKKQCELDETPTSDKSKTKNDDKKETSTPLEQIAVR